MSDGINDYGGGSPGRPGGYDRDKSVSPPAQEVKRYATKAEDHAVLMRESENGHWVKASDYTSKCAELERVKLERDEYGKNWVESINLASERLEQLVAVREQLNRIFKAHKYYRDHLTGEANMLLADTIEAVEGEKQ
jgi:hypothetical protein